MNLERLFFRWLRFRGDVRAAERGPRAYGLRLFRRSAHRSLARLLRRIK